MSTESTLDTMFRHNRWANLALVELCAGLTDAQLDATLDGTFGSIRATLDHIARAERSYFSRISTGQRHPQGENEPLLSVAEVGEALGASGDGLIAWAERVQPADSVAVDWDGTPREVPKTVLLTQVINHATEHRAQIMAILTQLGVEPPELSGWEYFGAMHPL
jgi:uncharacterized damage-inducible protein DinB